MEQVKRMMEAGVPFPRAVRECLAQLNPPLTLEGFAEKYEINASTLSGAINGSIRPSAAVVSALVQALGGTAFEWRYAIWKSAEPVAPAEPTALSA